MALDIGFIFSLNRKLNRGTLINMFHTLIFDMHSTVSEEYLLRNWKPIDSYLKLDKK